MQEIGKFDVNGSEKYMAFTINKNLLFIDIMQFLISSLDESVKKIIIR